jgi:hypothetical protein
LLDRDVPTLVDPTVDFSAVASPDCERCSPPNREPHEGQSLALRDPDK